MLNRIIQAPWCLAHENLFKIYSLMFLFDSCILLIVSNKFSSVWLMKSEFESIQYSLILFNPHMELFYTIQILSHTIQSLFGILWYDSNILWYYTSFIWNSLKQFKYSLILFNLHDNPDFTFYTIGSIVDFDDSIQTNFLNVIVGQTYSYLTRLYILLLTHFSTDWNNK